MVEVMVASMSITICFENGNRCSSHSKCYRVSNFYRVSRQTICTSSMEWSLAFMVLCFFIITVVFC